MSTAPKAPDQQPDYWNELYKTRAEDNAPEYIEHSQRTVNGFGEAMQLMEEGVFPAGLTIKSDDDKRLTFIAMGAPGSGKGYCNGRAWKALGPYVKLVSGVERSGPDGVIINQRVSHQDEAFAQLTDRTNINIACEYGGQLMQTPQSRKQLWEHLSKENRKSSVLVVEHITPAWLTLFTGQLGQLQQSVGGKHLAWPSHVNFKAFDAHQPLTDEEKEWGFNYVTRNLVNELPDWVLLFLCDLAQSRWATDPDPTVSVDNACTCFQKEGKVLLSALCVLWCVCIYCLTYRAPCRSLSTASALPVKSSAAGAQSESSTMSGVLGVSRHDGTGLTQGRGEAVEGAAHWREATRV